MKYAYFNPADGRVLQWIDTESNNFVLPDKALLHECTKKEWEIKGDVMRKAGILVPYEVPQPTPDHVAEALAGRRTLALDEVRKARAGFFSTLSGLQSEALARGDSKSAMAIAVVQQGARDITKVDLSDCESQEQIDAKFKSAWDAVVNAAPESVILAFTMVNA